MKLSGFFPVIIVKFHDLRIDVRVLVVLLQPVGDLVVDSGQEFARVIAVVSAEQHLGFGVDQIAILEQQADDLLDCVVHFQP